MGAQNMHRVGTVVVQQNDVTRHEHTLFKHRLFELHVNTFNIKTEYVIILIFATLFFLFIVCEQLEG